MFVILLNERNFNFISAVLVSFKGFESGDIQLPRLDLEQEIFKTVLWRL